MPIVSSDIKYYLSGGAANSDPNAALGGAISSTQLSGTPLNNLFDDVAGAESSAGDTEYRGIYVKNTHGTLTLQDAKLWIESQVASGANVEIALADEGLNATMETIANEDTAPSGPVFSAPTDKPSGLSLGNIPAGQFFGIWVKRIVPPASSAQANDGATLRVEGDTDA
jgi:hypothetical protein